jgi:hypothetical protein
MSANTTNVPVSITADAPIVPVVPVDPVTPIVTPDAPVAAIERNFKSLGRYAQLASEAYDDSARLTDMIEADRFYFACCLANEVALHFKDAKVNVKFGKLSEKNDLMTMSELAKVKGILPSRHVRLARLMAEVDTLRREAARAGNFLRMNCSFNVAIHAEL